MPPPLPPSPTAPGTQLGKFHGSLHNYSASKQRDFAKKWLAAITHGANPRPRCNAQQDPANATAKLFAEYKVPLDATPPSWLVNLYREIQDVAEELVAHPIHGSTMDELRATKPEKAARTSSALHYVLCPYEYRTLNFCLEHGATIGLLPISDGLDGYLWLAHSFGSRSHNQVFSDMSSHARQNMPGMNMTIRSKPITLPPMPLAKTRRFNINSFVDVGDAGQSAVWMLCDRHWCSLQGRSKAVVVDIFYYEGTDIIDYVVERTVREFVDVYRSCKLTLVSADNGKPKTMAVPVLWLDRNDRPIKETCGFYTTKAERDANPDHLSLFTGFKLDAEPLLDMSTAVSIAGVSIIQKHVKEILANGDEDCGEWITKFHAWMVQRRIKCGVFCVFEGASGVGKSSLYFKSTHNSPIFPQIFGSTYMSCSDMDQVVARFNVNSGNKLVCVVEELAAKSGSANMAKLKFLADSKTIDLEAKHLDTVTVPDNRNFVLITNYKDAFDLTTEFTRKLVIFRVSDRFAQERRNTDAALDAEAKAHFVALNEAMADPTVVHGYYSFLMGIDLDDWNPYDFPQTAPLREMAAAANALPTFFQHWSRGAWHPEASEFEYHPDTFYPTHTLHDIFVCWASATAPRAAGMGPKTFANNLSTFATSERARAAAAAANEPAAVRYSHPTPNERGYVVA